MKNMKTLRYGCFLGLICFFESCIAKPSIAVCFPGVKPILPKILELIDREVTQIDFALYALLHCEVVSALSRAVNRGVKVSGIVDQSSIEQMSKHVLLNDKYAASSRELFELLQKNSIGIYASHGRAMHNKVMCFASSGRDCEQVVVTGSANFTASGLNGVAGIDSKKGCSHNFENVLILQGYKKVYEQYMQEIDKIRTEVKRQYDKRCNI